MSFKRHSSSPPPPPASATSSAREGDRLYLMGYPNPGETRNRVDRANDARNGLADAIYVDHFDELIAGAELGEYHTPAPLSTGGLFFVWREKI